MSTSGASPAAVAPRPGLGWPLSGALAVLAFGLLNVLVLQTSDQLIDDAFIFFRYVDNLLAGHGLTWNPGEERVEGYTSFLYTMLLAGPRALGAEPVLLATSLNVALFIGTVLLSLRMLVRAAGGWSASLLVAPALLATSSSLGESARSGMELMLFSFLLVLASHLHLHSSARPGARFAAGAVSGLLVLTRPEGILAYLVSALVSFREERGDRRAALTRELQRFLGLAAVIVPHLAWRIAYYHDVLPNTYYAKVGFALSNLWRGLGGFEQFLGTHRGAMCALALLAWAFAPATRVGGLFCAYLVAWLAYNGIFLGLPDWKAHYTVPVDVFALLLLGWSASTTLATVRVPAARSCRIAALVALVCLLAGNLERALANNQESRKGLRLTLVDAPTKSMISGCIAIGKKLREMASPGDSLATGACGAIPYYSGLITYDTLGLNDKHIARLPIEDPGAAPFGHEKGDGAYILSKQPTYLIMLPFPTPQPKRGFIGWSKTFSEIKDMPEFLRGYEFLSVELESGQYFNYFKRKSPAPRSGTSPPASTRGDDAARSR